MKHQSASVESNGWDTDIMDTTDKELISMEAPMQQSAAFRCVLILQFHSVKEANT